MAQMCFKLKTIGTTKIVLKPINNVISLFSREEEAIKLDGLNVAQMKELRDKAEKHVFQAEVDRMMKLIINSLYKNKEVRHRKHGNFLLNRKLKRSHVCFIALVFAWPL